MAGKYLLGYGLVFLYMFVPYILILSHAVEPVILGLPYAIWSQILYGLLATPLLYFVFKLVWPKFPKNFQDF